MKLTSQFQPIPVQQAALDFVQSSPARNILLYGGGGSGKSILISHIVLTRALNAPNSRHGVFRATATSCRRTLFDLAFRTAMEMTYPGLLANCAVNETEMTIELPNRSVIFFAGFDPNNMTRIMGDEFATIWVNECDEFNYEHVTKLRTRLRNKRKTLSGRDLSLKIFFDLNPDTKDHFSYRCFVEKMNPARNVPLGDPDDWAAFQMNLAATDTHVPADYLANLMDGDDASIQRMVDGYWRDERESSMFRASDIAAARVDEQPDDLTRIVVAVDPAISDNEKSDETGIVVAAVDEAGEFFVLADRTVKGPPSAWAEAAVAAYDEFGASIVVAEKNQGGAMVEETLRHVAPNLPIKLVHASVGKAIRAEPVSALYARKRVHHVGEFPELERQMVRFHLDWNRRRDGSPDRLDALVWALTELAGRGEAPRAGTSIKMKGWWS